MINEEQAREALLQFVSEHCCYGKGAATNLVFRDLKSSSAFHVRRLRGVSNLVLLVPEVYKHRTPRFDS